MNYRYGGQVLSPICHPLFFAFFSPLELIFHIFYPLKAFSLLPLYRITIQILLGLGKLIFNLFVLIWFLLVAIIRIATLYKSNKLDTLKGEKKWRIGFKGKKNAKNRGEGEFDRRPGCFSIILNNERPFFLLSFISLLLWIWCLII